MGFQDSALGALGAIRSVAQTWKAYDKANELTKGQEKGLKIAQANLNQSKTLADAQIAANTAAHKRNEDFVKDTAETLKQFNDDLSTGPEEFAQIMNDYEEEFPGFADLIKYGGSAAEYKALVASENALQQRSVAQNNSKLLYKKLGGSE